MANPLAANASSEGVEDAFSGNFTKALYLRSQSAEELEARIGYGSGRLAQGWWLLFALERPAADNFEFGGYTHFSGSRIGPPALANARPTVESDLEKVLGGPAALQKRRAAAVEELQLSGPDRLAKVLPVARGNEYPVGTGIFQCNIPRPIRCRVAAFVPPGGRYLGMYG
jgi:hypothetical protein